jgi:hypothetical protein
MIDFDTSSISCDDRQEAAALGPLALMTGISEEFWCAGWMAGLEDALWRVQPGTKWGQGTISERQALLLRLLSEECDGWWRWEDNAGPVFVKLADWVASRP